MGALRSSLTELALAPVVAYASRQRDVPALVSLPTREATRARAAAALGDLRAAEAIGPLLALLGASSVRRRETAADALGRMAGLASVSVERFPAGEHGPPPPCIRVTPAAPTARPITVQVDHWEQVSLFMVEPTWDERWIPDRHEYLEWVQAAVSSVVDGRYEQWVRPGPGSLRGSITCRRADRRSATTSFASGIAPASCA